MAQTELEQIAIAMMMMSEDPERRRKVLQPLSTTAAQSPQDNAQSPSEVAMRIKEEESDGETTRVQYVEKNGGGEESDEVGNNYSINPNSLSTPSPSSPAGSLSSSGGGGGGGANSATRRIFTPEFKQSVLDAFNYDSECIGNQRATARKFNIHRRQVQKWLQQLTGNSDKDQQSSADEQEQKAKTDKEVDFIATTNYSSSSVPSARPSIIVGKQPSRNRSKSKMPIVAGKGPLIPQASIVSSSPSASLPSSSPLMSMGKGIANIHHPLFQNNSSGMFMGLTSPLMSMPAVLESSSSRHSPPLPLRQSPPQGQVNGGSHNGANLSSNGQRMLELVDELCYLYPSEDFSLLRRAMMKNEVSFTKLSPPIRRHNNRKNSSSPVQNDYITQQTLQMIKNQNEYLQLLQSGYANFSNFQDTADPNNGKYASWLSNPFAAAAAAGFNVPGLNKHGNGAENNRKKGHNNNDTPQNQYNFALPKAPLSNSKSKTVAAVLAATRNGSSAPRMQNAQNAYNNPKPKRPSQRRKMTNGRPPKQMCSPNNDDDFLDPMSMLEVVTSRPSPIENNYHHNTSDSLGMDLSTTAGSVIQRSPQAYPSSSSTIRSKAMNKDYGFLSDLGLVRKEDEESINGHTSPPDSSTASLEHFVDSVLHHQKRSSPTSSSGSPVDPNPVNESKDLVLEAFNYDPEMAGDPRAVARKFGLNIRVVQKWIREAPTRSIPLLTNGNGHSEDHDDEEDYNENLLQKSVIASTSSLNTNGPTINKRKNPKPNQICDFTTEEDLDENGALDMVVPIKKRRLSTPTPTSA